jgi:hypothetical protein
MDNSSLNSNHNRYTTKYNDEKQFDFNNELIDFKNQEKVINTNNKNVPSTFDLPFEKMYTATPGLHGQRFTPDYNNIKNRNSDKYDPLGYYLYNKGDRDFSSITRYNTYYLNIDSRLRNKYDNYQKINYQKLAKDPITTNVSIPNTIIINTSSENNYEVNDRISLVGLGSTIVNLNNDGSTLIQFTNGSQYAKVNYNLGYIFNTISLENFMELNSAISNITSMLRIRFEDIKGQDNTPLFIGNIPITTLNTNHQIYLYNPDYPLPYPEPIDSDPNFYNNGTFYFKLVKKFEWLNPPNTISPHYIKFFINFKNGIPNNLINSQYPIGNKHHQGYLTIYKVEPKYNLVTRNYDTNNLYIKINTNYNSTIWNHLNLSTNLIAGNNICIAKITEINKGNGLPTNYTINLNKVYNNVVMIKLISTEFPSIDYLVYNCIDYNQKNDNSEKRNSRLYWQNLDDGDLIYSITIDEGNYKIDTLISIIEEKISKIPRIKTPGNNIYSNNNKNIIKIEKLFNNSEYIFKSYQESEIIQPFINIVHDYSNPNKFITFITVSHINHHLNVGDIIQINNAIDTDGILASNLNNKFTIYEKIDKDNYKIKLENLNLTGNPSNTNGGNYVKILSSNIFRLRFDFTDTIGSYFGFRKLGDTESITMWNSEISNKNWYYNEWVDDYDVCIQEYKDLNTNITTNTVKIKEAPINIQNYYFMTINSGNYQQERLNNTATFCKIKNVFAKIQNTSATGIINDIVYNGFVNTPVFFNNPLPELDDLKISFYDKNGDLVRYNDFEHSMTIEIVCLDEIPEKTNFDPKYPKVN